MRSRKGSFIFLALNSVLVISLLVTLAQSLLYLYLLGITIFFI